MAQRPGSGGSGGGGAGGADTTYTKIFVGGLAWETQCETMRRYFEQFGEIMEAVIITDKNTGRSRGYGFVTFRDPDSACRACQDPAPVIDGRRTNCNLAALGAHQRPRGPVFQGPRFFPFIGDYGAHVYPGPHHLGQPMAFPFQQGVPYPPHFGYHGYGPEFYGPQAVYGPFLGPQLPTATMFTPASPTFQQQEQQQQHQHQQQPSGFGRPPPSPPQHALISPYQLVPIPFPSPPGILSPTTAGPMPSPPRFVLPPQSPQQPFTPGGSSEHSSG